MVLSRLMSLLQQQGLTAEAIRRYKSTVSLLKKQGMPPSLRLETFARHLQLASSQLMEAKSVEVLSPLELGLEKNPAAFFTQPYPMHQGHEERPRLSLFPMHVEIQKGGSFSHAFSTRQQEKTLEATLSDCSAKFGIMLAQTITLVQQWYGMAMFSHELQNQIDQRIKDLEALKPEYASEAYLLSRRSFLMTLATLPATLLASREQAYKIGLELEEFFPQCAASLIACWHLSGGSFLEKIPPIIEAYLPALLSIVKYVPS